MKHAGRETLDRLEPFLARLRKIGALKERSHGVFYRSGRAFLHFHEHGEEIFADMRVGEQFARYSATVPSERDQLMKSLLRALGD